MASKKTDPSAEPKKTTKKAAEPKAKKAKKVAPAVAAAAPEVEARPEVVLPADHQPRASHEEVARRAYEIWLARGGSAFENWVEAERQLNGG